MPHAFADSTIGSLRDQLASTAPAPAGVSAACISASFALGLLEKVIAISVTKKEFLGDAERLETLRTAAGVESARLLRFAAEDAASFNEYVRCLRLPRDTGEERAERDRAKEAAMRRAIEVPLQAACSAELGIGLCAGAAGTVHAFVIADLGAAAALLDGAIRAMLVSVDYNLGQISSAGPLHRDSRVERTRLARDSARNSNLVLERVASVIDAGR
jgi:formiminotetrahydrofolate cyclodeaminase